MRRKYVNVLSVMMLVGGMGMAQDRPVMTSKDLVKLPVPAADKRIQYGPLPLQFGDLRMPQGKGPFPLVIVVHGGCWLSAYDLSYLASFCAALTKEGMATWCIEYRRVGDEGGGWPGTFHDVAAAADFVGALKRDYPIDLDRVVVVGHSAGGHLALWLAGRRNIPTTDPLGTANRLRLLGVVSLAGITDLARGERDRVCDDAIPRLLGGSAASLPDRLRTTSPMALLPLGVRQVLVVGGKDTIVPESQATTYQAAARVRGDNVEIVKIAASGHFELITPGSIAWPEVRNAVLGVLAVKPAI